MSSNRSIIIDHINAAGGEATRAHLKAVSGLTEDQLKNCLYQMHVAEQIIRRDAPGGPIFRIGPQPLAGTPKSSPTSKCSASCTPAPSPCCAHWTNPSKATMTPSAYRPIALAQIAPSGTHIQAMRRARFDKDRLIELADSIRSIGLQQPIVLRKHPNPHDDVWFEIVAGERRFLAAQIAELTEIECKISDLNDEQVLEVQLVENLQREGLHELEEAEGYEALMKLKHITADEVALKVGKSRSYVFGRLKLLALCPEARKVFYGGKINASVALLIARIGHHNTQREALKEVMRGDSFSDDDSPMSFRAARNYIERHFMLELKDAPFDVKAVYFHPAPRAAMPVGTPCAECPKLTGNQVDLFSDITNKQTCTDPVCWSDKVKAANTLRIAAAEQAGQVVIQGKAARALLPSEYSEQPEGYVQADQTSHLTNWKVPAKLLGKDLPAPVLILHPHTDRLIEAYPEADIKAAMKRRGIRIESGGSSGGFTEAERAAQQQAKIEVATRLRILAAVREVNITREYTVDDTRLIAVTLFELLGFDRSKLYVDFINAAAGIPKPKGIEYVRDHINAINNQDAAQLKLTLLDLCYIGDCHSHADGGQLEATAQRLAIDTTAIRKAVKAEFAERAKGKGKDKGKATPKPAPATEQPPKPDTPALAEGKRARKKKGVAA